MLTRLRTRQDGLGLIELLMALTILNVGILATVAALNSGAIALRRASTLTTASTVADRHMELFRAIRYADVALLDSSVTAADADTYYVGDGARRAGATMVTTGSCTSPDAQTCEASQTVTGPDGKSYRIDTYVFSESPTAAARALKSVTVVVRDARSLAKPLVRAESTFDESTGS